MMFNILELWWSDVVAAPPLGGVDIGTASGSSAAGKAYSGVRLSCPDITPAQSPRAFKGAMSMQARSRISLSFDPSAMRSHEMTKTIRLLHLMTSRKRLFATV